MAVKCVASFCSRLHRNVQFSVHTKMEAAIQHCHQTGSHIEDGGI